MGRNVTWGEMSQGEMLRGETSFGEKRRIALPSALDLFDLSFSRRKIQKIHGRGCSRQKIFEILQFERKF